MEVIPLSLSLVIARGIIRVYPRRELIAKRLNCNSLQLPYNDHIGKLYVRQENWLVPRAPTIYTTLLLYYIMRQSNFHGCVCTT